MNVPTLPPEIFYDILGLVTPPWIWGQDFKPPSATPFARTELQWFLNLRLVNKTLDNVVIDHFQTAIKAKRFDAWVPVKKGPATPSSMAFTRRVLVFLVHRDRGQGKLSLINTISQGAEGGVELFSGDGSGKDAEMVRTTYVNGLIGALVGILGPGFVLSILAGYGSIDHMAELEGEEWRSAALMAAAYLGCMDDVRRLLELGVDINFDPMDKWLYPPLMAASLGGQEEVVRFLIEQGVDPNTRSRGNGENAVHFAAVEGHESMVQLLIHSGAEADVTNNDGEGPLLWAAGGGHVGVVQVLLAHGANTKNADWQWRTPLMWATIRGYDEVVRVLLQSDILPYEELGMASYKANELAVAARLSRENIFNMMLDHPGQEIRFSGLQGAIDGGGPGMVKALAARAPDLLPLYRVHDPRFEDLSQLPM